MTPVNTEAPDIHARFKAMLEALDHSSNSFARLIGVNPSQIVNVVGGRLNKPSLETLEKISQSVPRVNMDWLVGGKGEMMKPFPGQEAPADSHVVMGTGNAVGRGNRTNVRGAGALALEDCQKELQHWIEKARAFEALADERKTIIDLLKRTA